MRIRNRRIPECRSPSPESNSKHIFMKHAGQTSGACALHWKWRVQVAAREVIHAKDKGSTQASFAGTGTAPDRQELLDRAEHGLGISQSGGNGGAGGGGFRRPGWYADCGGASSRQCAPAAEEPVTGTGLRRHSRRTAKTQTPDPSAGL